MPALQIVTSRDAIECAESERWDEVRMIGGTVQVTERPVSGISDVVAVISTVEALAVPAFRCADHRLDVRTSWAARCNQFRKIVEAPLRSASDHAGKVVVHGRWRARQHVIAVNEPQPIRQRNADT